MTGDKLLIAIALATAAIAPQADPLIDEYLAPPSLPPASITGEAIEPEVTIVETDQEVIYEYRVRGQLYMVRVEPIAGPPYYLLDIDGDGVLDVQDNRPWNMAVPQWTLFSW